MIVLYIILGLLAIFFAVVLVRTLLYTPVKLSNVTIEPVDVNSEKAVNDLAEMLKCKTVSDTDSENEDEKEFLKFEKLLPKLFPNIHAKCEFQKLGRRSLLFKWEGMAHDEPTVLMSHYDVVSVEEDKWQKPAFDGIIEDGVLWGRGALDTKGTLNAALQAAEALISTGFVPKNDIYFAFGGDEEINGTGAVTIVELFRKKGIKPGLVVDEGGAVVTGVFPAVTAPCALIGIAEKGMLNVKYSVHGGGGHASAPGPNTPIGRLSKACTKLENKPFKYRLTPPAAKLFDALARQSNFLYKMIFANLWCFAPVLNLIAYKTGGQMNALLRTTVAFTQMEGSKGMNVIPPEAYMVSNHRLIHGDTVDSVVSRIKKVVNDDKIEIEVVNGTNPSVVSRTDCEAYTKLETVIRQTWENVLVSPYLMTACSDSRHWGEISDKVYRFSPFAVSNEERATVHGNDERIPIETVAKMVEFYIRLIKNC